MQPIPQHRKGFAGVGTEIPHDAKLRQVETLTEEMKHLLKANDSVFDDEVICRQIDLLEHWMGCYRRNLVSADTLFEAGTALVSDLQARLRLAEEEIQRLEDEDAASSIKEQIEANERLLQAIRRSEKLLADIQKLFPNH